MTSVEDQFKFIVPLNRDTEHIYYNQRIILDAKVLTEPRAWQISKVNRLATNGLCMVTMAQDLFDPDRDYIEKDEYGNIIGMWADWYPYDQYNVQPEETVDPRTLPDYFLTLKYAGIKPVIKVRGNFKKFTAIFNDKHGNEVPNVFVDEWKVELDGVDVTTLEDNPFTIVTSNEDNTLTANQIKVKTASDEMLGKVLTITATKDGLVSSQNVEIVGM